MASNHLDEQLIASQPEAGDAIAHLLEVALGLRPAQIGQLAAARSRGLEGVVDLGELGVQERQAPVAVSQPEILEARDVAEVPDERAHQRGVNAFEILVRHAGHERERLRACLRQSAELENGHPLRIS